MISKSINRPVSSRRKYNLFLPKKALLHIMILRNMGCVDVPISQFGFRQTTDVHFVNWDVDAEGF